MPPFVSGARLGYGRPMLYAILCYDSEDVVGAWSKAEDDAALARLEVVQQKLAAAGRLGPVARLLPWGPLRASTWSG